MHCGKKVVFVSGETLNYRQTDIGFIKASQFL